MSCKILGLLSSLGKPVSSFFHTGAVRFQGIARARLQPWKGPVQVTGPAA